MSDEHPYQLQRPGPLGGKPLPYVRIRWRGTDGTFTDWALDARPGDGARTFWLLRPNGQPKGAPAAPRQLICAPTDLIYVRPARLDLIYERLEVIP